MKYAGIEEGLLAIFLDRGTGKTDFLQEGMWPAKEGLDTSPMRRMRRGIYRRKKFYV